MLTVLSIATLFWTASDEPIVFAVDGGPLYATTADSVTTCSEGDRVLRRDNDQRDPAWSADGRDLAYSRKIEGVWTLHSAAPSVPLAANRVEGKRHWSSGGSDGRDERWPAWSRDGALAYVVRDEGGHDTLRVAWPDDEDDDLEVSARIQRPHWSPDGRWIAFARGDEGRPWSIWVVEVDGDQLGEPMELFDHAVLEDGELAGPSDLNHPRWHPLWPDDDRIMFVHHRQDGAWSTGLGAVSVSLEGGALVPADFRSLIAPMDNPRDDRLYQKEGPTEPTWSPDGSKIAYAVERSTSEEAESSSPRVSVQPVADLMVAAVSALENGTGDDPESVTDGARGTAQAGCPTPGAPTWSPMRWPGVSYLRSTFSPW